MISIPIYEMRVQIFFNCDELSRSAIKKMYLSVEYNELASGRGGVVVTLFLSLLCRVQIPADWNQAEGNL